MCCGNGADRRPDSPEPEKTLIGVYAGGFKGKVRLKSGQMRRKAIPKPPQTPVIMRIIQVPGVAEQCIASTPVFFTAESRIAQLRFIIVPRLFYATWFPGNT